MGSRGSFITVIFEGDNFGGGTVVELTGEVDEVLGLETQTLFAEGVDIDSLGFALGHSVSELVDEEVVEGWGETEHVEDLVEDHFGVSDEIRVFGLDVGKVEVLR
jgi:hypothetical protein